MLLDHFKDMLHEGQSLGATWIMHSDGLTIETTCEDGPASKGIVFDVTAANPGATATIVIGKPLGSIQRFHMVGSRCREPLPADWAGVTQVSLVNSAPMGCMVDDADRNVLSFAYSFAQDEITMRYGVDEEHVLFVVMLQIQRVPGHSRLLLMDDGLPLDETMRLLVEWVADGSAPLPMADKALEPVFSTWYAYLQNVDAETLGRELDDWDVDPYSSTTAGSNMAAGADIPVAATGFPIPLNSPTCVPLSGGSRTRGSASSYGSHPCCWARRRTCSRRWNDTRPSMTTGWDGNSTSSTHDARRSATTSAAFALGWPRITASPD